MTTILDTMGLAPAMKFLQPLAAASARVSAVSLCRQLALLRRRAAERRQLLAMDERSLKDLGITRYDAIIEGTKPLWIP
jgi:uncharacterized protein YjiS (DUF1127 family)